MRIVVATTVCSIAPTMTASPGSAQTPRRASAPPRAGQGVTAGWGDERVLSTVSVPVDLAYNFARAIAVDTDGRVHVVWYERRDGKECACYRRSTDSGKSWQDAVCLADTSEPMPHDAVLPAI